MTAEITIEVLLKRKENFANLVHAIKERPKISIEDARQSFIGGNTMRSFRVENSRDFLQKFEPKIGAPRGQRIVNLVNATRDSLFSTTSIKKMENILEDNCLISRLNKKKCLARNVLAGLRDFNGSDTNIFKRIKIIDLALKYFILTQSPTDRIFRNTDAALDSRILRPLRGEKVFESLSRRQLLAMGDVRDDETYRTLQEYGRCKFDDGWTMDFLLWDLDRIPFIDGISFQIAPNA